MWTLYEKMGTKKNKIFKGNTLECFVMFILEQQRGKDENLFVFQFDDGTEYNYQEFLKSHVSCDGVQCVGS